MVAGIEHIAGDMFVSIPKGDAIFMKVGSLQLNPTNVIYIPF